MEWHAVVLAAKSQVPSLSPFETSDTLHRRHPRIRNVCRQYPHHKCRRTVFEYYCVENLRTFLEVRDAADVNANHVHLVALKLASAVPVHDVTDEIVHAVSEEQVPSDFSRQLHSHGSQVCQGRVWNVVKKIETRQFGV